MDKEQNEGQNIKNAMAFIPLLAFVFYVIDKDRTDRFNKNLSYAVLLFIAYIFFVLFFGIFFKLISVFIILFYISFSFYLGFKAYSGEDLDISFFNDIISSINNNKKK